MTLSACSDDNSSIGIEGIDASNAVGELLTDTLFANSISSKKSFVDSITTAGSDRLYLGSMDSYDFRMIMRFAFGTLFTNATVQSCKLKMFGSNSYGTGMISASVHEIERSWTSTNVRWSEFSDNSFSAAIATFDLTAPLAEGDVFELDFPVATVQQWVDALSDTGAVNNGALFDFSTSGLVQQFFSADIATAASDFKFVPRLVVSYLDENSIVRTDSIIPSSAGGIDGYLYRDRSPRPDSELNIGSGVVYHSFLRFNTASLSERATINKAELILHANEAGSYLYQFTDSIAFQAIRTITVPTEWMPGKVVLSLVDLARPAGGELEAGVLRIPITAYFQTWTNDAADNFGFRVFQSGELINNFREIYRVNFHTSTSDLNLAPMIVVYYTLPPGQG